MSQESELPKGWTHWRLCFLCFVWCSFVLVAIPTTLPESIWKQIPERIKNVKVTKKQVPVCPICAKKVHSFEQSGSE